MCAACPSVRTHVRRVWQHSLCYFSRYLSIKETLGHCAAHEETLWKSVRQPTGAAKGGERDVKRIKLKELVNIVGKGKDKFGKPKFVGMDAAIEKLKARLLESRRA